MSMEEYSVPSMAYILQCNTSSSAERVTALRSLRLHLETDDLDAYTQKRIKQLILDNVLKLILNPTINDVKRALMRTELFLMLAQMLDCNSLFGGLANAHHAGTYSTVIITVPIAYMGV
jgi:hypothetical protein